MRSRSAARHADHRDKDVDPRRPRPTASLPAPYSHFCGTCFSMMIVRAGHRLQARPAAGTRARTAISSPLVEPTRARDCIQIDQINHGMIIALPGLWLADASGKGGTR